MNLSALKSFAPEVRIQLIEAVGRKLDYVLTADTADLRAKQSQRDSLREQAEADRPGLIERVAYTWFNRLAALRFLDAEGRHPFQARVITAATTDETQPEVLRLMRMGSLPAELGEFTDLTRLNDLLDGRLPTATAGADPQGEVYRHLILAACRFYHAAMPFVFEAIDDETELLLPDDLLTPTSVAEPFRSKINDEDCQDVEIIGWLYQFYISEKKDEVFAGLKKNKKITPDNIPAATQLFTPNWIVRYLVENSLGRLWMLNRPNSHLIEKMDYYIKPEQEETDFLRIASPEEIKVCDPACGSGHMLVYAFDLLYAIYEEEGYEPSSIPEKILTYNLFGIDLDERAGTLAAFALAMKARAKSRRFFRKPVQPNICVLQNIQFEEGELKEYMNFVGRDLFTAPLINTLHQFEEANNFGSLIRPEVDNADKILSLLESKTISAESSLYPVHQKGLQALRQSKYLSPRYHVVIANPPYMGGKGMNGRLGAWAKEIYPDSKSDLMTCFMERAPYLTMPSGAWGMINLQSWMFISTYENLRRKILTQQCIQTFLHLGRGVFGSDFGSVAFVIQNSRPIKSTTAVYRRLFDKHVQVRSPEEIKRLFFNQNYNSFRVPQTNLMAIPGYPISYWASNRAVEVFQSPSIGERYDVRQGLATADDERFLKSWHEISLNKFSVYHGQKWFPFHKGGDFRKWYGNQHHVVNWENDGFEIRNFKDAKGKTRSRPQNISYFFRPGVTWSIVSSGAPSFRQYTEGFIIGHVGPGLFSKDGGELSGAIGILNSRVSSYFLGIISETFKYEVGHVNRIPLLGEPSANGYVGRLIDATKSDWNSYETSWEFNSLPLLQHDYLQPTLKATYQEVRTSWKVMMMEVQRLEEENNSSIIEAYDLKNELTPKTPLSEITLTCNPHYRYGGNKTDEELEAQLQEDTAKEFISYAVGCMFGRYSLEKPGLVLANQGETLEDYIQKVQKQKEQISFLPDDDAIIPVLNGEWFEDDAVARVREFLRVTFGNETLETNLRWLEESIGKNLRAYFCANTGGFYDHHIKTYKKRPIYWMFQSPKKHFRALAYLHRYTKDTVNQVLDGYLREFMHKLRSRMEHLDHVLASDSTPTREATQARREKDQIIAALRDCEEYEREILLPLAQQRIELDLDDGVKVNYNKLGNALAKVTGLSGK